MAGLFRVYARRPFPLCNPGARLQLNMCRNSAVVKGNRAPWRLPPPTTRRRRANSSGGFSP